MASEWLQTTQFVTQQLHLGRGVGGAEATACFYHVHNPLIQLLQTETPRNAPHGLRPGSETLVDWAQTFLQQRLGANPAWPPPSSRATPAAPGDRPAADTAFLTCELLPRQSPARLPNPTCLGRVSRASPTALLSSAARSGSLSSPQLPRSLDPRPLLHRDAHPLGCLSGSPPLPPQQV